MLETFFFEHYCQKYLNITTILFPVDLNNTETDFNNLGWYNYHVMVLS